MFSPSNESMNWQFYGNLSDDLINVDNMKVRYFIFIDFQKWKGVLQKLNHRRLNDNNATS